MHPLISLTSLLSFAVLVPWLPLPVIALVSLGLAVFTLIFPGARKGAWQGLRRVRWLLLSLAVLYLGFTPGEPLLPEFGVFSPSANGLELALHRGLIIVVMLLAATLYLQLAGRARIIAGLYALLKPFGGAWAGRLAARFLLVLENLSAIEAEVKAARSGRSEKKTGFMDAAAELVAVTEAQATAVPAATFELPVQQAVPYWQWLLPLALLATGIMVAMP